MLGRQNRSLKAAYLGEGLALFKRRAWQNLIKEYAKAQYVVF